MKIKVGVFWLCNFDIVYDVEELEIDENKKELYFYSFKHREVWKKLSENQFNGKYSKFPCDFFLRGRVYYNSAIKEYLVVMNDTSKHLTKNILDKIYNLFEIK